MQSSALAQACEPEWDTTIGQPGIVGLVNAMAEFEGEVYVGGDFSIAGEVVTEKLARWNGDRWRGVGAGIPDIRVRRRLPLSLASWIGTLRTLPARR